MGGEISAYWEGLKKAKVKGVPNAAAAPVVEKRIDSEDGQAYTREEFAFFYKGEYSKNEISAHWEGSKKAKVKAVPKAAAPALEKRIDPEDGQAYTREEFALFYNGENSKAEISAYWEGLKKAKVKGAVAVEKRIDPEDGQAYTTAEFALFYKGVYSKSEISVYWESLKKAKAKAKAKGKAKAKAKGKTLLK